MYSGRTGTQSWTDQQIIMSRLLSRNEKYMKYLQLKGICWLFHNRLLWKVGLLFFEFKAAGFTLQHKRSYRNFELFKNKVK